MIKKAIITLLFTGIFWGLALPILAQSDTVLLVDGEFKDKPIADIVQYLSEKYQLQLFIPPNLQLLPTISISFEQTPLPAALYQILKNTHIGFIVYRGFAIVLAPNNVISQDYSSKYYQSLEASAYPNSELTQQKPIVSVGSIQQLSDSGRAKVFGNIFEEESGKAIIGASIVCTDEKIGTTSTNGGTFELHLSLGEHHLHIEYLGFEDLEVDVNVLGNGELRLGMTQQAIQLEEVVIEAEAVDANVSEVQTGIARINVQELKKLPTVLGEADVVKNLLLQPGVSSIGEGASGFNVRGGDVDQNLILQDNGMLFNSAHALGFYSTFNADLLNSVTLYKGAIPAQFGGRLASVLDVELRDGNFDQFKIKGGLGLVASRLSIEGPLIKGKSSFILGGRSTYSDWILNRINIPEVKNSSAFFYDINFRYSHRINDKNTLILSAYSTQDDFIFNGEFGFKYQTLLGQTVYKTIINDHLYSQFNFSTSQFSSEQIDLEGVYASTLQNGITYYKLKEQLTYHPYKKLKLDMGLSGILYDLPGQELLPRGSFSTIKTQKTETEKGIEAAVFLNADWRINNFLQVTGGLRLNNYYYLGRKTIYQYSEGYPYKVKNQMHALFDDGIHYKTFNLAPRLSIRYKLNPKISLKTGYSRVTQYINQLSNSNSPTPNSHWQMSTAYIPPKQGHNFSVGYFMNFDNNMWESSIDIYGRYIDKAYDYRNFAELVLSHHIETEIRRGIGRSYGLEISLKKKKGAINGSVSYTLSKSELKIDEINHGEWYPADIDRLHDLSLIGNFSYNSRNTFTINFNYQTGRPTTPPIGNYIGPDGIVIPIYTRRNHLRIPDYHRLDIAYTIGMGHSKTRKIKTSWTFSIYNVYGRRNAFSIFFTQQPFKPPQANRLAILGSAFPSVSFNLETF